MKEIIELTDNILNDIDIMTEHLYQEKEDGITILNTVIGKIESLLGYIAAYQKETGIRLVEEQKLLGTIGSAFQALQNQDIVLLADIFYYDIKEQLMQIR